MPKDCSTEFSKSPFVVVNRLGTELSQMNKGIWRTKEYGEQMKKKKKEQTNRKTKKQGNKDLKVRGKFYFVLTP